MLLHIPPFSERRLARGRGANNVPNIASCVLLRNPSRIDHKHWSPAPIWLSHCHSGAGCSVLGAGSGSTRAGLMANMCAHFLSGACSILGATRDQARQARGCGEARSLCSGCRNRSSKGRLHRVAGGSGDGGSRRRLGDERPRVRGRNNRTAMAWSNLPGDMRDRLPDNA